MWWDNDNKKPEYKLAESLVSFCSGYLAGDRYFREELWKKNDKLKNFELRDVYNVMLIQKCYSEGVYVAPVGCSWASEMDKEEVEEFLALEKNKELLDDYWNWQLGQR